MGSSTHWTPLDIYRPIFSLVCKRLFKECEVCALDKLCAILYVVSEGQFGKNGLLESFVLTHASTHINIDKMILGNIFNFLTI